MGAVSLTRSRSKWRPAVFENHRFAGAPRGAARYAAYRSRSRELTRETVVEITFHRCKLYARPAAPPIGVTDCHQAALPGPRHRSQVTIARTAVTRRVACTVSSSTVNFTLPAINSAPSRRRRFRRLLPTMPFRRVFARRFRPGNHKPSS